MVSSAIENDVTQLKILVSGGGIRDAEDDSAEIGLGPVSLHIEVRGT